MLSTWIIVLFTVDRFIPSKHAKFHENHWSRCQDTDYIYTRIARLILSDIKEKNNYHIYTLVGSKS